MRARAAVPTALALVPGALLAALALASGGFFPDATAVATLATLALLLVWVALAPRPFEGLAPAGVAAALALVGFAVWTLVSQSWSDAPARALLEAHRVVLYLGVLVLFASLRPTDARARLMVGGLAVAALAVCVAALAVWLVPDRFSVDPGFRRSRLNWPLGYWNAAGLVAAFGAVWATHLTSSLREAPAVRVVAAGGLPVFAAVLYLTASRGALAASIVALAVYVAAGATRGVLVGLAAGVPAVGAAVAVTAGIDGLARYPVPSTALAEGHRGMVALALCSLGAVVLRAALLVADRRLAVARLPRPGWPALALVAVAVAVAFVAFGGPREIDEGVSRFGESETVSSTLDPSDRFTQLGNNGRVDHWRVALDAGFEREPLHGTGAGTYALLWARERDTPFTVIDGHSLYIEVLGELGLVGAGLLVAVLVLLVGGLAVRARRSRGAWGALLATAVAWAAHAGVDWDWEMPALTAWVFAAGGLALARTRERPAAATGVPLRVAVVLVCAGLAVMPVRIHASQTRTVDAVVALQQGDCRTATEKAASAQRALRQRPEPYEIVSYCEVRADRLDAALRAIRQAVDRDPGNWELRYAEALVLGASGRDPRPAARAAYRRNPRHPYTRAALVRFDTASPDVWRRRALASPLPLPVVRYR